MVSTEVLIYVGLMLAGLTFLLFGFIGGSSGDAGGDVGHDVGGHDVGGHDVGGDASGLSPLSAPMIAVFLSVTGATGATFALGGGDAFFNAIWAIVAGTVGFLGLFLIVANFLVKAQASSLPHEKEFEGKTGTVTETISETGVGAIAITVRGMRQVVSARSDGRRIPINAQVLVKRINDSVALVEEVSDKT